LEFNLGCISFYHLSLLIFILLDFEEVSHIYEWFSFWGSAPFQINKHITEIMGKVSTLEETLSIFKNEKYFSQLFSEGFISNREWSSVEDDMSWRDWKKICERSLPIMKSNTKWEFILYFEIVHLFLFIIFIIYFFILFQFLYTSSSIESWGNINNIQYQLFNSSLTIFAEPHIKTAILLAVIITLSSRTSEITCGDLITNRFEWLHYRSKTLLATKIIYDIALTPNYQFWRENVNKDNIFNIDILVDSTLSKEEIEKTCHHAAKKAPKTAKIIIVVAFVKEDERQDYFRGTLGKRYQLIINEIKNIKEFKDISFDSNNDLRYSHDLGFNSIDKNEAIPDKWFGEYKDTTEIGKEIWNLDPKHTWILHPYVFKNDKYYAIEMFITCRFKSTKEYKNIISDIFKIILSRLQDFREIDIAIYFRDQIGYELARLEFKVGNRYYFYRDEYIKNKRKTSFS
jgi:hypothetical protein